MILIAETNVSVTVLSSAAIFLVITLLLVILLLVAKHYLVPSGKVHIDINNGKKDLEVTTGSTLLNTLHTQGVMLSSACGGKGSCGQCKVQVLDPAHRDCALHPQAAEGALATGMPGESERQPQDSGARLGA